MNIQKNNDKLLFTEEYLKLIYFTTDLLNFYPKKLKNTLILDTKINLYKGFQCLLYAESEKNYIKKTNYLKKTLKYIKLQEKLIDFAYYNKYIVFKNYIKHCKITNNLSNKIINLINTYNETAV